MKFDKRTLDLISELEYIISRKCFNPKSYNGWKRVQGLRYRYPVTCRRDSDQEPFKVYSKVSTWFDELTPSIINSLRYRIGTNELYIGQGLIEVLEFLEDRYSLDFSELEEKRATINESCACSDKD